MFGFGQDSAFERDRNASGGNLIDFVAAKSSKDIVSVNADLTISKTCNRLCLDDTLLGEPLYRQNNGQMRREEDQENRCAKEYPVLLLRQENEPSSPRMVIVGHFSSYTR